MAKKKSTSRASVLTAPRILAIEERPLPEPKEGEVLVQVSAVGICGSDVHYFREGRLGRFIVDRPLVLGHEASGVISDVGAGVSRSRIGERVAIEPQKPCHTCDLCVSGHYNLCRQMRFYGTPPVDGALSEFVTIESAFAHTLPDSVSDEAGALLEPLSVALAAVKKAEVAPGKTVLVAGAGPVGILCLQVAMAFGASDVIISDPAASHREAARSYGATSVVDPESSDVEGAATGEVDCFIDASGSAQAVCSGIERVGPAGVAVLVGLGNPRIALPVEHIQNSEITVKGVFRYASTWPLGIDLVKTGRVDVDSLVSTRHGLEDVESAMEPKGGTTVLKSLVYPSENRLP